MLVRIAQLFENGRPLPRHRSITAQPVHPGILTLTEQFDQEFRRSVACAALHRVGDGGDVVPRLYDAAVRWIGNGCMTINGFERDEVTRQCIVQSWYVQIVTDASD